MQLNISHVRYTYPGAAETAVNDVTVVFREGWTGLVGNNGCGKTTLALIAAGILTPDTGTVLPALSSAYCPQDSTVVPPHLEEFATDWGSEAVRLRRELGVEDDWPWRYAELSGGQQKRLQVACALWELPDVLILDEPTNDLDAQTRAVVGNALEAYRGIGVLISHDRELLDRLARQCLMFEDGHAILRPGNFSEAHGQATQERSSSFKQSQDAKRELSRLQREAQRRSEKSARSKGRLSARDVGKHDSDMRARLGLARVTGKDTVAGRASAVMAKRIDRAAERLASTAVTKHYDPRIQTCGRALSADFVVHLPAGRMGGDDFELDVPELWVCPTDHVGISGNNGSGKSTLLRRLLELTKPNVRVAYVPQSVSEQRRDEALRFLRAPDSASTGQVLSLVARLNSDPDRLLDGGDTSPGELRKLMLAEQLLREPNLLVLDEPTNHLDLGSIQALQAMLSEFPGALVLVSHDRVLLEATCPIRWNLGEGPDGRFVLSVR